MDFMKTWSSKPHARHLEIAFLIMKNRQVEAKDQVWRQFMAARTTSMPRALPRGSEAHKSRPRIDALQEALI